MLTPGVRITTTTTFRGNFRLRGDKSISHRAAILGALAEGETRIENFSSAADCGATLHCLSELGVDVAQHGAAVTLRGRGPEAWRSAAAPLDAGNSGSTLRMLAGAVAGRPFRSVPTGDASLRRRPLGRVAAPPPSRGAPAPPTPAPPPPRPPG